MNIKHRMARAVRSSNKNNSNMKRSRKVDRNDPCYEEKRRKNNEAIKKTRAKAKAKQEETQRRMTQLRAENTDLELKIKDLSAQLKLMKNILEAHHKQQRDALIQENIENNKGELSQLIAEMNELNDIK